MMKKTFFTLGILALIIASMLSIKQTLSWSSNAFWNFVATQFDKEEEERQQMVENGEIVRGKDTILIWENLYEICHYYDSNHLEITSNGISYDILEKVTKHKVKENKLYVLSEEGYAVVDKNNICRIFITVPEKDFVNGYSVDEQGNKHYYTRYIENEYVQYISQFNEYSEEEQKIFNKLQNNDIFI